jgi:hypothetical protein
MKALKQWLREVLWRRTPGIQNDGFWNAWAETVGERHDAFLTVHARPRHPGSLSSRTDSAARYPATAIVLQGPVMRENSFTRESIAMYRRHFPHCTVIHSTWAGEDRAEVEACRAAGATIVLSEEPRNPGPSNINRQIVSTRAGVKQCAELGLPYALKTRTDQRIYNPNALAFLHSAMRAFPLRHKLPGQHRRLIGISLNTLKYRRYGLSDMLLFGALPDMQRYWDCSLDPRAEVAPAPFGPHAELCLGEVWFETHFLQSLGRELKWTIEDSWRAWAEHFCVVDATALDLYWPKYQPHREFRRRTHGAPGTGDELSFADWLTLLAGHWQAGADIEAASNLDWNTPLPTAARP